MKITAFALSAVLVCSTGAFAQTSSPATSPSNGSSMSNTQPGNTNGANGNAMQDNGTPSEMNGTVPMNDGYRHHRGHGGWGLWGLLGLFGLFGVGRRRTREDVVATTATRPR